MWTGPSLRNFRTCAGGAQPLMGDWGAATDIHNTEAGSVKPCSSFAGSFSCGVRIEASRSRDPKATMKAPSLAAERLTAPCFSIRCAFVAQSSLPRRNTGEPDPPPLELRGRRIRNLDDSRPGGLEPRHLHVEPLRCSAGRSDFNGHDIPEPDAADRAPEIGEGVDRYPVQ